MIRILVADDHTVVREGLKHIIEDSSDIIVTDEAVNGKEVLNKVRKDDYDLVLLDIAMPGTTVFDILGEIKSTRPELPVLILSMYPEERYASRVLKAGTAGYLTKDSAADKLITAIQKVSRGKKYISSSLAEKLAFESLEKATEKKTHEELSNREYEVMCTIASGRTLEEIAETLSLSPKTISTYRTRILEKMNMNSNAEIIHYAIENKLVNSNRS